MPLYFMQKTNTTGKVLILLLAIVSVFSCGKSNKTDKGCGCGSDSAVHYLAYDNFSGFPYTASCYFDTSNHENAWFIGVSIPNSNYSAWLKVCNPDLPAFVAIREDTSAHVAVSGKLKLLCPDDSFGFHLPETLTYFIAVDSIKKVN
jgi:hypothetical protein